MKKLLFSLTALLLLSSCQKPKEPAATTTNPEESYINATSKTTWHYYSTSQNKIVGTGEEVPADNATWFARTDWDFAVNRYSIRTNSGAATSVGSKGGVYTTASSVTFASLLKVPDGAQFIEDKEIKTEGMGGTVTTTIKSDATVIKFKVDDAGNTVMPPVYLSAPIYVFRTADGSKCYKIQFTQYQNEDKVTGHVKFYSVQL